MSNSYTLLPRQQPLERQPAYADLSESDTDGAHSPITFAPANLGSQYSTDALVNSDVEMYNQSTLGIRFNPGRPTAFSAINLKPQDMDIASDYSLDTFESGEFDYVEMGSTRCSSASGDYSDNNPLNAHPLQLRATRSTSPYSQVRFYLVTFFQI
jgi:hypothetical protein